MKRLNILLVTVSAFFFAANLAAQRSPNVSKVLEFVPGPGQFVNENFPAYTAGDTKSEIISKASDILVNQTGSFVSLGAWGGYTVVGFDHPIINIPGQADFKVYGNAFGSSAEPGIVMVAQDRDNDGKPDQWYELAGSEYLKETTVHNYQLTYYRPGYDSLIRKGVTPDEKYISSPADFRTGDANNNIADVRWKDNLGNTGYILRNTFHKQQSYYPMWITEDSLTFNGSLLRYGVADDKKALDWGYADNWDNNNEKSNFNIDWAVDKYGNPVRLTHIDFVKIYTAMQGDRSPVGEISTELAGVEDLHPDASLPVSVETKTLDLSDIELAENGKSPFIMNADITYFDVNNLFRFNHSATDWGGGFVTWGGAISSKVQADLNAPEGLYVNGTLDKSKVSGWEYNGTNEYAAITNGGVAGKGTPYILGFGSFTLSFTDEKAHEVHGAYVTNAAINYISMKYGDPYAKTFGGANGTDPDYLRLIATGKNGDTETGSISFNLADYSSQFACDDYIVTDWSWMNLSALGKVTEINFTLESSDNGEYGMNTPAYFCMDKVSVNPAGEIPTSIINPTTDTHIAVYPNPAAEQLTIDNGQQLIKNIIITDVQGRIIHQAQPNTTNYKLSVANWAKGVYIVKAGNKIQKLIKQ